MARRYFINDAENPPHVVMDSQKTKTGIFHLAHLAKTFNSDCKKKNQKTGHEPEENNDYN